MIIIVGGGCRVLYFVVGVHTLFPTMLIIDNKGDDNLKQKNPVALPFEECAIKHII